MRVPHFSAMLVLLLFVSVNSEAADWPSFRGPSGDGLSVEKNLPTEWDSDKNIKWRTKLPSPANGSPVVADGRVYVTYSSKGGSKRTLACYDRSNGKELWTKTVNAPASEKTHKTNPYSGTTPAIVGNRIVVWHGSAGLFCYDSTGKKLWKNDLGKVTHIWGYGSSPVIHEGRIFLNFGPGANTFMAGIDLKTGDTIWKQDEAGGSDTQVGSRYVGSWSTPVIANVNGEAQVVCVMPKRVVSYQPETGDIIWTVSGVPSPRGDLCYTSPMIKGNLAIILAGYKGPAFAFEMGGKGDITKEKQLWRFEKKQPQRIGSGIIQGDYLYMANDGPSTAQCINIKTGKSVWRSRFSAGHWASTVYADGKVYSTNQDGVTNVYEANPKEFKLISKNELKETCNSTPALSDGEIFIQTHEALYCISNK